MRLTLCAAAALASLALGAAARPPNIIVVLVDDCGVGDFGFSGGRDVPTPHIDRLAAEGVVFSSGYALPSCSPTRAALLTGRYPQRFGIEDNRPLDGPTGGMDRREATLPQRLREAGYHTRLIGKWHLGKGARFEYAPRNRGFDAFYGYFGAAGVYFDPVLSRDGDERKRPGYITDLLTDEACRFLREPHDKPFFLHLAHMAAHLPQAAKPEDLARVSHLSGKRRLAAAILVNLDDNMGRLLAALRETGLDANTLLFFLSDNGAEPPVLGTSNGPYRGMKFDVLEGGIRVPFCARWPGTLPAGRTYAPMVHVFDVCATALAAAGVARPEGLDGADLLPYVTGTAAGVPHARLFWLYNDHQEWRVPGRDTNLARPLRAVREGDEKLVALGDGPPALYDLARDPGETDDLAPARPERAAALRRAFDAWRAEMTPQHIPDNHPLYGTYKRMAPEAPDGYRLVWSDEFNVDGRPNTNDWTYERGFVRNNELQWYQPDNAFCSNGCLIIEGRRERRPNPGYRPDDAYWGNRRAYAEYTSSSVTTKGLHSWQYGRFEVRARLKAQAGLWPAIWFLGLKGRWPACGEIDLMEYYKGDILANACWASHKQGEAKWDDSKKPVASFGDPAWDENFHVWRMDWDEQRITLALDGETLNTIELAQAVNPEGREPRRPFHQPFYLLLNLALGGNQGGDPSKTTFPTRFEIDYVRVYQKGIL